MAVKYRDPLHEKLQNKLRCLWKYGYIQKQFLPNGTTWFVFLEYEFICWLYWLGRSTTIFLAFLSCAILVFLTFLIPLLFSFSVSFHFFAPSTTSISLLGGVIALAKYCIHLIFQRTETLCRYVHRYNTSKQLP